MFAYEVLGSDYDMEITLFDSKSHMGTVIPQFWALAVCRRLVQIGVQPCFFRLYIALGRRSPQDKNGQIGVYPFSPCGGDVTPSVILGKYNFKILNIDNITPKEYFTNVYVKEIFGSENVHTNNKQLHVILYYR